MKAKCLLCLMAGCLLASNTALALPYVYAKFVSVAPGGSVTTNLGRFVVGVHNLQLDPTRFSVGDEGQELVTLAAATGYQIDAFCIEPGQAVPTATPTTPFFEYSIIPPEDGPLGGTIPPMGLAKAQDLSKLFDAHMGVWNAGNVQAAAFQLAAWEILLENPANPYSISIYQGSFYATSAATVVALANTWLAELASLEFVDIGLHVLTNDYRQDFAVIIPGFGGDEVPEPLTMLGVGLGVAGMARYLRRRTKNLQGV